MTLAQNDVSATCERRKMTNDECRMSKRPLFIGKHKVDRLLLKTMLE